MKTKNSYPLSISLFLLLAGCALESDPESARLDYMERNDGPIQIALVWPLASVGEGARQGAEMAVKEINGNGGVADRELELLTFDDQSDVSESRLIAQEIIQNPRVAAVIGHYNSYVTLPNAPAYNYGGVILINPASSSTRLSRDDHKLVMRTIPSDEILGEISADHLHTRGHERVLIYHEKNAYGRSVSNVFEHRAQELGMTVVARISHDGESLSQLRRNVESMRYRQFDAIFFAGSAVESAAALVKTLRQNGVDQPILNPGGLDNENFIHAAGVDAEGIKILTPFHHRTQNPQASAFVKNYGTLYGETPGVWAAQVYDAIMLWRHAANTSPNLLPETIAETWLQLDRWEGVTGTHQFDAHGDLKTLKLSLIAIRDGQFHFVKSFDTSE